MYEAMYVKMLEEMRVYAKALDNAIKAVVGLQALGHTKGRPSKAVAEARKALKQEDTFSIVDPGFKPPAKSRRYKLSAATRNKMSLAQKKRFAALKRAKKAHKKVIPIKKAVA